jgi:hypothetical protein
VDLRECASAVRSNALIEEMETDGTYGFGSKPHRTGAKSFQVWIGVDGLLDLHCGAIRSENAPMPPAEVLIRFCKAIADGRMAETEWLRFGWSMKLITEVESGDEWQPEWRHTRILVPRIPLRFCQVIERRYRPYAGS